MTTQTTATLKAFCNASNLNPSLIRAVVRQMGGWESFTGSAHDVAHHGIDGGFHGFIWNKDTEAFAKRNRKLISELASQQASEYGSSVHEMIRGFGCFRGQNVTDEEIGSALYAGRDVDGGVNMLNALAWYAGEEVCRSYSDLAEQD